MLIPADRLIVQGSGVAYVGRHGAKIICYDIGKTVIQAYDFSSIILDNVLLHTIFRGIAA